MPAQLRAKCERIRVKCRQLRLTAQAIRAKAAAEEEQRQLIAKVADSTV